MKCVRACACLWARPGVSMLSSGVTRLQRQPVRFGPQRFGASQMQGRRQGAAICCARTSPLAGSKRSIAGREGWTAPESSPAALTLTEEGSALTPGSGRSRAWHSSEEVRGQAACQSTSSVVSVSHGSSNHLGRGTCRKRKGGGAQRQPAAIGARSPDSVPACLSVHTRVPGCASTAGVPEPSPLNPRLKRSLASRPEPQSPRTHAHAPL